MKISTMIACGLMLVLTGYVHAATFYVATHGSDSHSCAQAQDPATPKRTLQSSSAGAIPCLSHGDTLYIRGGTYDERITNFTHGGIRGGTSDGHRTIIAGYPGETVVLLRGIILASTNPPSCPPHLCDAAYVTFRNIIVDGGNETGRSVSTFQPNIRYEFITVRNTAETAFFGPAHNGVFQDCTVHDTVGRDVGAPDYGTYGWYLGDDAANVLIERCTAYNISGYAVHNWSNQETSNITIRDSHFYNTGTTSGDAILISHGSGHQVYNNLIENTLGFGITLHSTCRDCKVFNNTITNTVIGIDVGTATNPEVSHNLVTGSVIINICPRDAAMVGCGGGGQSGAVHTNNACDRPGIWCDHVGNAPAQTPPPPPQPNIQPSGDPISSGGAAGSGSSSSCSDVGNNFFVGCYYSDRHFGNLALVQHSSSIDFDWGGGSPGSAVPSDNFSARWQGDFDLSGGQYNFVVTADDGVRLYVDGELILDQWFDQAPTTYSVSRTLGGGRHRIVMEFYENGGGAVARLSFNSTSGAAASAFDSTCGEVGNNFFVGCYYRDRDLNSLALVQNSGSIDFDWGGGSPDSAVPVDHFSARWQGDFDLTAGEYNFVVTADDGVRLYIDGELILDQWFDQAPTTYSVSKLLSTGRHRIVMEFYERGGGAVARLSW